MTIDPPPLTPEEIKELRAKWESLTLKDNYLFGRVLEKSPKFCKWLLSAILKMSVKEIVYPQREKTLGTRREGRGVRLDVYVEERGKRRVFDVEMQVAEDANLLLRVRYYQSTIDADALARGKDFDELPEVYIIFICDFDPFDKGRALYTLRHLCLEDSTVHVDYKTTHIFINIHGEEEGLSPKLKDFLNFIKGTPPKGAMLKEAAKMAEELRLTSGEWLDYIRRTQEARYQAKMAARKAAKEAKEEGRQEGRQEGLQKGRFSAVLANIKSIMKKMQMTAQEAMDCLDVPASDRPALAAMI